ncbi:hypothetical protein CDAR_32601 [Caerostris darwini]|uniref:Uncharacterized protein n=1 Tax=Caerostris darwini TaxID=1538125 RepID=A0AAV4PEN1_9ARAC|nr:hypothetical protein CDAR_32601 [Caerostris darwini]
MARKMSRCHVFEVPEPFAACALLPGRFGKNRKEVFCKSSLCYFPICVFDFTKRKNKVEIASNFVSRYAFSIAENSQFMIFVSAGKRREEITLFLYVYFLKLKNVNLSHA